MTVSGSSTPRPIVKLLSLSAGLAVALGISNVARGGHELPMYPSYYPHEITIETIPPERAAPLLIENKIQAYLGPQPRFSGDVPVSIRAVESLGSFIVVLRNPVAPGPTEPASACAAVETIVGDIAGKQDFVFHPYPITPFHGDYLYHADLAEAAKARFLRTATPTPAAPANLRVKASGALQHLVRPE